MYVEVNCDKNVHAVSLSTLATKLSVATENYSNVKFFLENINIPLNNSLLR